MRFSAIISLIISRNTAKKEIEKMKLSWNREDEKAKQALDDDEYEIIKNEKYSYKFKVVELFEMMKTIFEK